MNPTKVIKVNQSNQSPVSIDPVELQLGLWWGRHFVEVVSVQDSGRCVQHDGPSPEEHAHCPIFVIVLAGVRTGIQE